MFKKVVIAALAVVVGGGFLMFGSRAVSHLRLCIREARQRAQNSVPPEREVKRLRMEVDRLKEDDLRYVDQIARLSMDVDEVKERVKTKEAALAKLDTEMKGWETALASEGTTLNVTFNGQPREYPRSEVATQLRTDARRFLNLQASLKGDKDLLKIKQETLTLARQKRTEVASAREQMLARLQQIENALLEEQRAQARGEVTADSGRFAQVSNDLKALEQRVKLMQARRKLQASGTSDAGPIRANEAQAKPDTEVDNLLKVRRDGRTAPVATRGEE
jgi:predicted nuclease with TOPRIM domain